MVPPDGRLQPVNVPSTPKTNKRSQRGIERSWAFRGGVPRFVLFYFLPLSSACGAVVSHLDCLALQFYGSSAGERRGAGVSVHPSPARPRTDRLAANICQAAKAANIWKKERAPHLRRLTTTVSRPFEDRNMNRTSVKRGDRERRRR